MRLFPASLVALLVTSCARLPDQVPMEANFTLKTNGTFADEAAPFEAQLVGAELLLGERVVATIKKEQSQFRATWTMPKADAIAAQKQTFTVRFKGTCGVANLPVMTDERWQRKPEKELAEAYGNLKVLPLFFDLPPVNVTTVFVDPGASNAAVRVGEATVAPGPKGTHLSLAGCPAQVPVRVGEEQVGTADGSMRATVVSADPGVCYVLQAAVYGDAADANAPPPQKSNGARVWSIKFLPEKFLERTEASVKAYGKGTYVMQVWRTDC